MSGKPAHYAVSESACKGRKYDEPQHPYRTAFDRDRDRIIHSAAFRRLEGKTQVFAPGLDDYCRTRMTHSIEVAQIGRTIARALNINESLTEAICLAHDLGHPPFGHAGEDALKKLLANHGGFEHNLQTLRIVDKIEHPYPAFEGLNLMYETRLGLAMHRSPFDRPDNCGFVERNCSLEGQVANIADRIAYNCHDLEDGWRARLINERHFGSLELFDAVRKRPDIAGIDDIFIRRMRITKTMLDMLVTDCIECTRKNIGVANPQSPQQVMAVKADFVRLTDRSLKMLEELESFLLQNLYHHQNIKIAAANAHKTLGELFNKLCENPDAMPKYYQRIIESDGLERAVADYISGMTDRYCVKRLEELNAGKKTEI